MDKLQQLHTLMEGLTVVDLSPTLEKDIPRWPTHPPLVVEQTVTHGHDGYYCQTVFMGEHTGAHVDAPAHLVPTMMEDTIETFPANALFGPAVVYPLDQCGKKPGERIAVEEILALEKEMGQAVGEGEIALLNFGWFQYWTTGAEWKYYAKNSPGLSQEAAQLFFERKVKAVGSDTIACDTPVLDGEEYHSYGHHNYWLPNRILMMEELENLDKLPSRCYFMAIPLKIKNGSGSPIRPLALVP